MHRFTPDGHWTAPAGQFAARIRASDLPGILSKKLLVDFSIRAVLVEDGEIAGELGPGLHTFDSLAERLSLDPRPQTAIVVFRQEEMPIELAETVLRTQDDRTVCVGFRASVQVGDATLFLLNVLGSRDRMALDEVRSVIAPLLMEQLRDVVVRMTLEELARIDGRRRLTGAMSEAGGVLHYHGFRLGPILEASIRRCEQASDAAATPEAAQIARQPSGPTNYLKRSGRRTIRYPEKGTDAPPLQPTPDPTHNPPESNSASGQPLGPMSVPLRASTLLVNSLGMRLVSIPSGSFTMGSPADEPEHNGMEDQHFVEISQPFHIGIFPITQDEYKHIMGTDPSCFSEPDAEKAAGTCGARLPVERVSWDDACEFCARLSERPAEKAAGRLYRLPTEAEWEYACRAGSTTAFAFGPSLGTAQANFDWRASQGIEGAPALARGTSPIGSFPSNAWGIYDMHGNVWEWCKDWFSPDYYCRSPGRDPQGSASGFARVLCGGGWRSRAAQCRSAARYSATATQRHDAFGFRVVCVTPKEH
jgi:formylglycine-generating enzyme